MQYSGPALHVAIYANRMEQFLNLVDSSSNFNMLDSDGDTVVHVATQENREEMLLKLIESGADINFLNKTHQPPLELAFKAGYANIIKVLLKGGANPNIKFKDGSTLLHNLVKSLDKMDLIPLAIAAGARIETQDRRGNTPLHNAVQLANTKKDLASQYTDIALKLINIVGQHKILFQPNLLRKSPLDIAIKSNNKVIIAAIEKQASKLSEQSA